MNESAPEPLLSGLLVIFGITGDLSRRYLLPALYHLCVGGELPDEFEIIGATRQHIKVEQLLEHLALDLKSRGETADPHRLQSLGRRLRIVTMDPTQAESYAELKTTLDRLEDERGVCLNRLFYLSLPPQIYGPVVDLLGASGLTTGCQHGSADSRLMIEKPFGYDLASATELVKRLHKSFAESQIYRIDHYLAKETAQNILTFRFANAIFQTIWDRRPFIQGLTITAAETIGIEGRAQFYEQVGALRDFVQNHLLQLLAVTTMEQPKTLDTTHIHAEKLKLLKAIRPIKPNEVTGSAVRGQYAGYRDEVQNSDSFTETFARLHLNIENPRWEGVPVMLQTGKRLNRRATDIELTFAPTATSPLVNTLTFRIQPDEGITIKLLAKTPGLGNQTQEVEMSFNYRDSFPGPAPDAYERVLMDGIRGDQTLFTSSDEVLTSWRIVEAVVQNWAKSPDGLTIYQPGVTVESIP